MQAKLKLIEKINGIGYTKSNYNYNSPNLIKCIRDEGDTKLLDSGLVGVNEMVLEQSSLWLTVLLGKQLLDKSTVNG